MDTPGNESKAAFIDVADRLRQDEQLIADILTIRNPHKTRWWESSPLTSMIVAVASLLLASATTIYSQRDAKLREFALAERATVRKERADVLSGLHKLIAVVVKNTDDRLDIATGNLNDLTRGDRDSILTATNVADDQWREQKENNDFLVPYYFAADKEIVSSWSSVKQSLQAYVACAESTYVKYPRRDAPTASCQPLHGETRRLIDELWIAVNRSAGVRPN